MRPAILAFCAFSFSALEAEQQDALQMLREGKFAQARNRALQLLGSVPENMAAIDLAMLHHVVGSAANQLGQYAQAEAHLTSGLEALRGAEPAAPELAVSLLTSLAESHLHLQRATQSQLLLQEAFRIAGKYLPASHPWHGQIWDGLGALQSARGEHVKAEKSLRKAYEIFNGALGPTHPYTVAQAASLATVLVKLNRAEEAYALAWNSHVELNRRFGPLHPETIRATYSAAITLLNTEPARAETILRDALGNWEISGQETIHTTAAMLLSAIAAARNRQRDTKGAIDWNRRALDTLRQLLGPNHAAVVNKMYEQAELLQSIKRKKDAMSLRKEADRIRELHGYPRPGTQTVDVRALRPNLPLSR
ncbi:MAG: tetratricopeptide repeat protein [Acidobacteria bacterium]|nr:tetratricopeptide repeat protein [Acidobacteriota bacterium]